MNGDLSHTTRLSFSVEYANVYLRLDALRKRIFVLTYSLKTLIVRIYKYVLVTFMEKFDLKESQLFVGLPIFIRIDSRKRIR